MKSAKKSVVGFRSLQTRFELPGRIAFRSKSRERAYSNDDIALERHSYLDRPSQRALVRITVPCSLPGV